jgi:hypothetical protein
MEREEAHLIRNGKIKGVSFYPVTLWSLSGLRNTYDRNGLIEKFKTLERMFYTPNYIHPSIRGIFFTIVGTVWLTLFFFYLGWNLRKSKSLPST